MENIEIVLPKGKKKQAYRDAVQSFAEALIKFDQQMPNKVSARGWCYLMEGKNLITKDQFDYCQKLITNCRKDGSLPITFTAMDKSRAFSNMEGLTENTSTPKEELEGWIEYIKSIWTHKDDIAFWETQEYYLIMVSEKIDIYNLFRPICKKYHIGSANMKGWSDLNSRNEMAQKYIEAENLGLQPVLLYYGDHDPDGLRIDATLPANFKQLEKATGWNPENLIVDRFGLNYDFIQKHGLLWIDNLKTGSGKDLASPTHPNNKLPYVQDYIKKFGVRKCEANAVLPMADIAKQYCEDKILQYLGKDCFEKYNKAVETTQTELKEYMEEKNVFTIMDDLLESLEEDGDDE